MLESSILPRSSPSSNCPGTKELVIHLECFSRISREMKYKVKNRLKGNGRKEGKQLRDIKNSANSRYF